MLSSRPSSDSSSTLGKKGTRELNKDKYEALPLPDDVDIALLDEQLKLRRKDRRWSKLLLGLCCSIFVVISIGTIVYLSMKLDQTKKAAHAHHDVRPTIIHTGSELGDCGHSIEQARAAGCHFDPMSWLWIPHSCYMPHRDLIDEWKSKTDWHFYTDVNMRPEDEVPVQSAYNGDYMKLYTPYKYHKIHCSYMWQKTHSILTQRLPIDDNTLNQRHMRHCQKVLLNEFFHEDVNCTNTDEMICPIRLIPEFTKCGYF